jgi:hypothetical protein
MIPNFNNNKNKHYSLLLTTSFFVIFNLGKKVKEVFGKVSPTSVPLHTSQGYKNCNKKRKIHELVRK